MQVSVNDKIEEPVNGPLVPQPPILTAEEEQRLAQGEFGETLIKLIASHITFFAFGTKGPNGEAVDLLNGTCFFLQTPSRLLLVTARHVVEAFRNAKERNQGTICQVGNIPYDPVDRLIAQGTKADIATLDITVDELKRMGKLPISLWPPHPPDSDDQGILLAGFPAAATIEDDPWTRGFGIYASIGVAQRATEWQLSCSVEWENTYATNLCPLPPRNYDTSGMSGGPVLLMRKKGGLLTFPLAGVISEGRRQTDTIVAERADKILADGLIRF